MLTAQVGPTLAEQLSVAGFGYRKSRIEGKNEVYRLSDGETFGPFDAGEAWAWLSSRAMSQRAPAEIEAQ